jgi:hypothetical protein
MKDQLVKRFVTDNVDLIDCLTASHTITWHFILPLLFTLRKGGGGEGLLPTVSSIIPGTALVHNMNSYENSICLSVARGIRRERDEKKGGLGLVCCFSGLTPHSLSFVHSLSFIHGFILVSPQRSVRSRNQNEDTSSNFDFSTKVIWTWIMVIS